MTWEDLFSTHETSGRDVNMARNFAYIACNFSAYMFCIADSMYDFYKSPQKTGKSSLPPSMRMGGNGNSVPPSMMGGNCSPVTSHCSLVTSQTNSSTTNAQSSLSGVPNIDNTELHDICRKGALAKLLVYLKSPPLVLVRNKLLE